jgi:LPXTG-motif cell wall-anchored protein
MNTKYLVAAGLAVAGLASYFFFRKKAAQTAIHPQKENERHHLTNAFSRAKQIAIDKS